MKRITVFCGSSFGNDPVYQSTATLLGQTLAKQNIELVYGGANVGLMGAIADGVLSCGGRVIGVLPHFLQSKELAHSKISELILVDNLHERKSRMSELSDGVIALPGGFGTIEEFFEMLTWAQLGLHKKPTAILNVNGFFDSLIAFVAKMVDNGFLKMEHQQMIIISDNIDELLEKMENYTPPKIEKWITKS
jgi:hypothetical protein